MVSDLQKIPCCYLTLTQDFTLYKPYHLPTVCSQHSRLRGQPYVDGATPVFGISIYMKTPEMESFTP